MSSKKKQDVSIDKAEKKKSPHFNTGKSKGSTGQNVEKNATAKISEPTDKGVIAAKQHSNKKDNSATSNNGKIQKIAKFLKKATTTGAKKTSKKANVVAEDSQQQEQKSDPTSTQEAQSVEGEKIDALERTGDKLPTTSVVDADPRLEKAATKVQAVYKGRNQRRSYLEKRQNIVKVEALARGFLARKQIAGKKASEYKDN